MGEEQESPFCHSIEVTAEEGVSFPKGVLHDPQGSPAESCGPSEAGPDRQRFCSNRSIQPGHRSSPQEQGKGMVKHLGSQVGKRLNVRPVHATGKGEGNKDAKNETA